MDLTPNFSFAELSHSDVALRRGYDNAPNECEAANLKRLAETLLEPARAILGVPMHVNSGFRCPAVNAAVGGAQNSAHMDGRACDFVPVGMDLVAAFTALAHSALPYDQIIIECNAWIHVAVAKVGADPRRMAMVAGGGPGKWFYRRVTA